MAKKNEQAVCPRADIGGQAVLDGVMMKAPDAVAVAVRRKNGDIVIKREPYESPAKKHKWMGLPFIRGSVNMVQMLGLGMRVLEDSMKMSGEEDAQEEPSKFEKWLAAKLGKNVDKVVMGVAVVMALAMSIGLFVLLPNTIILLFPKEASGGMLLLKNLVSGVIRIALLIAYISFVGRIPDMRRTFQYHGSEHKTVYCHEHDLPLTPKNAQQFTTLHPRCGTSFLLLTFFLSILFYSIIDVLVLEATGFDLGANYLLRVLSRLILLPCVAGISYEALKSLAHAENPLTRALRWPGLQMQRLTTRQPTDQQLEVAIASMNAALHGLPEGDETTEEGWVIVHHPDYTPDP
jgi:Predicted metal-dependent enzyme